MGFQLPFPQLVRFRQISGTHQRCRSFYNLIGRNILRTAPHRITANFEVQSSEKAARRGRFVDDVERMDFFLPKFNRNSPWKVTVSPNRKG